MSASHFQSCALRSESMIGGGYGADSLIGLRF